MQVRLKLLNNLLRDQSMGSRFAAVNKSALILKSIVRGVIAMKIPEIKYGKTKALIVNEFLKTDAKIKKDNVKEPEKIIEQYHALMYKCFGIVANEIDDFTLLIKETNNLLEQLNSKL